MDRKAVVLLLCLSIVMVSCGKRHKFVDLGLPSGTLWATCNIGASVPEEAGGYFAWGETEPKENYSPSTYKFYSKGNYKSISKYNFSNEFGIVDSKEVLDLDDDAAYVNWGGKWRMPTYNEWLELCDSNYCSLMATTQNGVKGMKITSKKNGKSLFLPLAGERHEKDFWPGAKPGEIGRYWSSTRDPRDRGNNARSMSFQNALDLGVYGIGSREMGVSVRPVRSR